MGPELQVTIPEHRLRECKDVADKLPLISKSMPILPTVKSVAFMHGDDEGYEQLLNNFWRPTLSVTSFEGLPNFANAGNTVYKELKLKVSVRLPPTLNSEKAAEIVKNILNAKNDEHTYNADVEVIINEAGNGFDAPKLPEIIQNTFTEAHKVR